MNVFITLITAISTAAIIWFLASTTSALRKFNSLDGPVKEKLALIDYYMVFARRFTKDELARLSELSDGDIKRLNEARHYEDMIKIAMEKLSQ